MNCFYERDPWKISNPTVVHVYMKFAGALEKKVIKKVAGLYNRFISFCGMIESFIT